MGVKDVMKKIFVKLGENNKPTYAVMAIAVVKGIARPLFTMTDKHADPETKKYTAIREGLTEVVAIPTYYACGELTSKIGEKLKFDHLPKDQQAFAKQSAKQNFMFLGVCLAALLVIPALASLTVKPFMKRIQENKKRIDNAFDDDHKLDIEDLFDRDDVKKPSEVHFKAKKVVSPYQSTCFPIKSSGMKVGGIW